MEILTDPQGNRIGDRALMCWGDVLPEFSAHPISNILDFDRSSDGRTAAVLVAPSSSVGVGLGVWVDGTVVLRAGDVLPDLGWPIRTIWKCAVNKNGDWAAVVDYFNTTTPTPGSAVGAVIKNGRVLYSTEHLPSHYSQRVVSAIPHLRLADNGRAAFTPTLTIPPFLGGGIGLVVVDDTEVIDPGVTTIPGIAAPLAGFNTLYSTPVIDSDGAFLSFQAGVGAAPPYEPVAVVLPLDRSTTVCRAPTSSTGTVPRSALFGTTRLQGERLEFMTRDLPSSSFGIALAARASSFLPAPAGAIGALCLGAPLTRSQPLSTGPTGTLTIEVSALLAVTGSTPLPGERWYFQTLYRDHDPGTGAAVIRLGEALSVVFD